MKTLNKITFGLVAILFLVGVSAPTVFSSPPVRGEISPDSKQVISSTGGPGGLVRLGSKKGPDSSKLKVAQLPAEDMPAMGDAPAEPGIPQKAIALSRFLELKVDEVQGRVSIELLATDMIQYTAFKLLNPLRLVMDFPGMEQGDMAGIMDVNKGVVSSIRPTYFDDAHVLRLEIILNATAAYEILKPMDDKLVVWLEEATSSGVAQGPFAVPPVPMGAEGLDQAGAPVMDASGEEVQTSASDSCFPLLYGEKERVSLDFQNAKIKNIFRILAEVGGLNLVLSPDVKGATNVRLVDVPWNKVLELILANHGLGRECDDNIVRIVSLKALAKEITEEPLSTEMVRVNHADLTELAKNLKGMTSNRGKIYVDERTNTLILTDVRSILKEMVEVVNALDIKTPQVMIEARIVEVTRGYLKELGIQWGIFSQSTTGLNFPNSVGVGADQTNFLAPITAPGFVVDLSTPSQPAGLIEVNLATANRDNILDIQLSALENRGKGKVLSNPKVTTLDNKEARIKSGTRIPFQTSSANEGTKVNFIDAVLELRVTPHITAEEQVYMQIAAIKNAADFANQVLGVPTITTKEATSEVLVDDGDTTVLGGLYQNETSENTRGVPFFQDIPFIGWLFKNYQEIDTTSELLIFITPTIVRELNSKS